ncbi:L-lactate dehydrogenase [Candidatus Dependentiae bacterium HGW-Dependentiae-1]|nr:MAG: L-lactate dehydrogenase [Candidatus Dependentiae bacterium HGW-Dependentiae-1]
MKHSKIAIIGAGRVGTTTAYALMLKNIVAEILLVDIDPNRCQGEIYDLADTLSFSTASNIHAATLKEAGRADIIVVTAGIAQQPKQSRTALIEVNQKIVTNILSDLKPINPHAIILMVTNPVDLMTLCAQEHAGLPHAQVFGSGTFLDSKRLQLAIANHVGVAEESVHAYVLGEHGDTQFPAWSCAQISGIPLLKFPGINEKDLAKIGVQTKNKAADIILCKGSTFFGIAICVAAMCESILFHQKKVFTLSVFNQEFGVCLSLPVVLGGRGIEKILPIPLSDSEQKQFTASAQALRHAKKGIGE